MILAKLIIENLNKSTTPKDLYHCLGLDTVSDKLGYIKLSIAVDSRGNSKGIAFVEIPNSWKYQLLDRNGCVLDRHTLRVIDNTKVWNRSTKLRKWTVDYKQPGFFKSPLRKRRAYVVGQTNLFETKPRTVLIDMGANILHKKLIDDIDTLIIQILVNGVSKTVIPGESVVHVKAAKDLCRLFPKCLKFTAGISPAEVKRLVAARQWDPSCIAELREPSDNSSCVAIGLTGLDFRHSPSEIECQAQIEAFEMQIQLAQEVDKPVYILERQAHDKLVEICQRFGAQLPTCVLYCFDGTVSEARTYIEMGFYIAITGCIAVDTNVCTTTSDVIKVLQDGVIPLDHLLLATNSPFKNPKPKLPIKSYMSQKGIHNLAKSNLSKPDHVFKLMKLVAETVQEDEKIVAETIVSNYDRLFSRRKVEMTTKQTVVKGNANVLVTDMFKTIMVVVASFAITSICIIIYDVMHQYTRKNEEQAGVMLNNSSVSLH